MARSVLVLGGARSGKSRLAEEIALGLPAPRVYVATAEALDDEMAARIARHRADRGEDWITVEAPRDLARVLAAPPRAGVVLVDCLTLWLSNLMLAGTPTAPAFDDLEAALERALVPVVLVSNEVGQGIVPDNALARAFRDLQGNLNRRVAARADRVVLAVAGLALELKPAAVGGAR